jgi:hypothetical protein
MFLIKGVMCKGKVTSERASRNKRQREWFLLVFQQIHSYKTAKSTPKNIHVHAWNTTRKTLFFVLDDGFLLEIQKGRVSSLYYYFFFFLLFHFFFFFSICFSIGRGSRVNNNINNNTNGRNTFSSLMLHDNV